MNKNTILGVIILIVVAVAVIGVLVFTSLNNSDYKTATYTDGVIVFSYPSNMMNTTTTTGLGNKGVWNFTTSLTNNVSWLLVGKTSLFTSPQKSSSVFISYLQSGNGQVVSNASESTNPNGIPVYRYAYTLNNGTRIIYYEMDFANKDNSTIYTINVWSFNQNQSQYIANQIFNSLKLT
ncbi:MAG: hypothetical protein ACLQG5_13195 [Methanobacterium sp.]|jgi:hypothetical protein